MSLVRSQAHPQIIVFIEPTDKSVTIPRMEYLKKAAVVPSGEFGSALTVPLSHNVEEVVIFDRYPQRADHFNRTKVHHAHPDITLPENVMATADLKTAVRGADLVVLASRSKEARFWYSELKEAGIEDALILSAVKGFIDDLLITEMILEETPSAAARFAVLSGPNVASDVVAERDVKTVIASPNENIVYFEHALSTPFFEVTTTTDYVGTQIGGAWKNPYGNGAGVLTASWAMIEELERYKEACIAEMTAVGIECGAVPETFQGLAGRGDLDITIYSQTRNFRAGYMIGKGVDPQALRSEKTYEGLYAVSGAVAMAKRKGIAAPIMEKINEIVNGDNTRENIEEFAGRFVAKPKFAWN